ncbi:HAD-IC family P-type ATPase [Natronoglycomyces albus]|uniref:HAD-IC family P-type ATPase n=1 Tax=Natronoglycomyces albus TaxID=2811108 RepID=A0A895XRQ3_9ACTN|nr:HAD-IC family P-type ATPase [Natronoglycomyces albus]QSB06203.1 HAD-IC family P-type ATPase [Natronoglycomyces albus]
METPVLEKASGLTAEEVKERQATGRVNETKRRTSRPISAILRGNFFTFFNLLIGTLCALAVIFGGWKQGLFGLVIVCNIAIGCIQEFRAKRTLDKLALVNQSKAHVIREGNRIAIAPEEIVADDLISVSPGDRLVVDGPATESHGLELDESLLTGEADPVAKGHGDWMQSGSFVVAGSGTYRAEKIGTDSYASRLVEEASEFNLAHSELRTGIDRFIKIIAWLVAPVTILLIASQSIDQASISETIVRTVAGIVPMIPDGLVLLTSIAFAVGVVRLGNRQCLVQELPAIEGLARTDVLCLDKTGTLTEGGMDVHDIRLLDEAPGDAEEAMAALVGLAQADTSPNPTMSAVSAHLAEHGPASPRWQCAEAMPFSSARKWSGIRFDSHGTWVLGAPELLLEPDDPALEEADQLAQQGYRVLVLASAASASTSGGVTSATSRALVILKQRLRTSARTTLEYFRSQHVDVKIISGDNPVAVGAVAAQLNVDGADQPVDARDLPTDEEELGKILDERSVFGRVSPQQKRHFVAALQRRGHTVAMTGDGVNDVLALKDADLGIAMGSGSPAARSVAKVVLLNDEFSTLPHIVAEGRRVLGNIERVSNLFLTKTVYAICLALMVGVGAVITALLDSEQLPYPFMPLHITLIGSLTIGIPAFFLAMAATSDRARPGFVLRVLKFAIPAGIVAAGSTFAVYLLVLERGSSLPSAQTTASITLFSVALAVLVLVARPYTWWRLLLILSCGAAFALALLTPLGSRFFELELPGMWYVAAAAVAAAAAIMTLFSWLVVRPRKVR